MSRNTSLRHDRSAAVYQQALRVTPGGVHSTSRLRSPHPLYFGSGQGAYVTDVDGNRYLDLGMGNGAVILGHAHPVVRAAVERALDAGLTAGLETPWAVSAAEKLAAMVPGIESVLFTNTGTEASLHAMRIARAYTGRTRVAKVEASYHGWHDSVWVSTWPDVSSPERAGTPQRPLPQPGAGGLHPGMVAETLILPFNDAEAARALLREHGHELACVFVEPTMIDIGFIPAAPDYLQVLREETRRLGIVLVFDELLTGFRLGLGGAQGRYGIQPDLSMLGKALANGHVIAAVGGRRDLLQVVGRPGGTAFVGTFNGHALSTAVADAVLGYLAEEPVLDRLAEATRRLIAVFDRASAEAGVRGHMVGAGGHIHWYFAEQPPSNYREAAAADRELYSRFIEALAAQGCLVNPGPLSHHAISLSHCDDDVLEFLSGALDRAVAAAAGGDVPVSQSQAQRPHLPIGYWLKRVDQELTARIDAAQAAHGLTRRDWQVLNSLFEVGTATRARVAEWLEPFADAAAIDETVERLIERGLVTGAAGDDGSLTLTDEGRRVHAAALETQRQIRTKAVAGIRRDDYVTTVTVLQKMVHNLTGGDEGSTGG